MLLCLDEKIPLKTTQRCKCKKMHTCEDVQLYILILYTNTFPSLLWPYSGCSTVSIQAIHYIIVKHPECVGVCISVALFFLGLWFVTVWFNPSPPYSCILISRFFQPCYVLLGSEIHASFVCKTIMKMQLYCCYTKMLPLQTVQRAFGLSSGTNPCLTQNCCMTHLSFNTEFLYLI